MAFDRIKPNIQILIWLSLLTYLVSYFYLGYYHHRIFLFNTILHESGEYTLLQTIFYASHFLGHIPIYTVLALLFIGIYLSLTPPKFYSRLPKYNWLLPILLIILLLGSLILSKTIFGAEDTAAFIMQQKQGVGIYAEGGAWNLHLPSTLLLLLGMPIYIYLVKRIFHRNIELNPYGILYFSLGIILLVFLTMLLNRNLGATLSFILSNPRYLAHSIRELATFPLTYFPIPLYFMLKAENESNGAAPQQKGIEYGIYILSTLFLCGVFYQANFSLQAGIGNIAQKPAFASSGHLTIPYLLASHYFEHVLDSIYFAILCLWLYALAKKRIINYN